MTEAQKEARKLFANLLNGIAVGSITGATITPMAAYIIGTQSIRLPDWWNITGFVAAVWATSIFLHFVARRTVLEIR